MVRLHTLPNEYRTIYLIQYTFFKLKCSTHANMVYMILFKIEKTFLLIFKRLS